jgi:hypothetical protein
MCAARTIGLQRGAILGDDTNLSIESQPVRVLVLNEPFTRSQSEEHQRHPEALDKVSQTTTISPDTVR